MSCSVSTQTNLRANVLRFLPVLRRVVMVMVTLSAALSWTASASASCGDYLYRNGKPVSHGSMQLSDLGQVSADRGVSENTPSDIPARRCSGPNCSSSPLPLAPVPAAPSNLIQGFDQSAVLESLKQTQDTRGAIEIPESERGACFEPSSIFRPPAV